MPSELRESIESTITGLLDADLEEECKHRTVGLRVDGAPPALLQHRRSVALALRRALNACARDAAPGAFRGVLSEIAVQNDLD